MSVVLRCPTCGTTQGDAGECEACSDGEVRYFCTNHDEGIWLDSPVCSRCGARFGDPPRKPRPPQAPELTRPPGAPDFRPPGRRGAPERPSEADFGSRPPSGHKLDEPAEPEMRSPSLEELLAEITDAACSWPFRSAVDVASGSSSWVPARGVSRQDRGLGVRADRRGTHLSVYVVQCVDQLRELQGHHTNGSPGSTTAVLCRRRWPSSSGTAGAPRRAATCRF